ncbi:MAG: hypothetical protein J6U70_06925 [Bacteroidales bacterium]|nr:hypothetical protein [Bacteroidales bacterium]
MKKFFYLLSILSVLGLTSCFQPAEPEPEPMDSMVVDYYFENGLGERIAVKQELPGYHDVTSIYDGEVQSFYGAIFFKKKNESCFPFDEDFPMRHIEKNIVVFNAVRDTLFYFKNENKYYAEAFHSADLEFVYRCPYYWKKENGNYYFKLTQTQVEYFITNNLRESVCLGELGVVILPNQRVQLLSIRVPEGPIDPMSQLPQLYTPEGDIVILSKSQDTLGRVCNSVWSITGDFYEHELVYNLSLDADVIH